MRSRGEDDDEEDDEDEDEDEEEDEEDDDEADDHKDDDRLPRAPPDATAKRPRVVLDDDDE